MLVNTVSYFMGTGPIWDEDIKDQFAVVIPRKREYVRIKDHVYVVDSVDYDLSTHTVYVYLSPQY